MKTRRHHNNKGYRQIRRGKTARQVEAMCKRLALPFRHGRKPPGECASGPRAG